MLLNNLYLRIFLQTVVAGVPLDGTPLTIIRTFHVGLVIVFDTLALLGIAFAVGCLFFNFTFRNRKLVTQC